MNNYKAGNRIHDAYTVTCPYCVTEQDDCYPDVSDDWEVTCQNCEKMFVVSARLTYSSERSCELNKIECDFRPEPTLFDDDTYINGLPKGRQPTMLTAGGQYD